MEIALSCFTHIRAIAMLVIQEIYVKLILMSADSDFKKLKFDIIEPIK